MPDRTGAGHSAVSIATFSRRPRRAPMHFNYGKFLQRATWLAADRRNLRPGSSAGGDACPPPAGPRAAQGTFRAGVKTKVVIGGDSPEARCRRNCPRGAGTARTPSWQLVISDT